MSTHKKRQLCNNTDYTDGILQREHAAHLQAERDNLPKRYPKARHNTSSVKPLVEQIGEDLTSPSEEIREIASATRAYVCAELGGHLLDSLDEREIHHDGWRNEEGEDQCFANEALDQYAQLHYTSFKEDETNDTFSASRQKHIAYIRDILCNLNLPERYHKAVLEAYSLERLFKLIDKDFSNPSREVREIAWIAFNFSFIAHEEDRMDRLNIQDVVTSCYQKLVLEGVFTRPRKHNNSRAYLLTALRNAERNEWRRPYQMIVPDNEVWDILMESPPESLLGRLSAESAEEEALRQISEDTLFGQLQEGSYLRNDREKLFFRAVYVDGMKVSKLAEHFGIKPSNITTSLSEIRRRNILRRDVCIAVSIAYKDIPESACLDCKQYFDAKISPYHLSEWFVKGIELTMEPALRSSTSLDGSEPVLLPLTSPIAQRPGRLFIYNGTKSEVRANLYNYLETLGQHPYSYYLTEESRLRHFSGDIAGSTILDEIVKRLEERCYPPLDHRGRRRVPSDKRLKLGLLSVAEDSIKDLPGGSHFEYPGDFHFEYERTIFPLKQCGCGDWTFRDEVLRFLRSSPRREPVIVPARNIWSLEYLQQCAERLLAQEEVYLASKQPINIVHRVGWGPNRTWGPYTGTTITTLIQNESFENTGSSWLAPWKFKAGLAEASISQSTESADGLYSADVNVTESNSTAWDVKLSQGVFGLDAGHTYTLSFWVKASKDRPIQVFIHQFLSRDTHFFTKTVNVTTSWQQYTFTYTQPQSELNAELVFALAQETGNVWIDAVSMKCVFAHEITHWSPVYMIENKMNR